MDVDAYLSNRQVQQAVALALIVIGEAIKALPMELRHRHQTVAWAKWAGLRDFLVHQYFRIDQRRIWRIVRQSGGAMLVKGPLGGYYHFRRGAC